MVVFEAGEADEIDEALGGFAALGAGRAGEAEVEGDVFPHFQPGHQRGLLEDHAAIRTWGGDVLAVYGDGA